MLARDGASSYAPLLQALHGRLDTEASPSHAIRQSDLSQDHDHWAHSRHGNCAGLSFACFPFYDLQAVLWGWGGSFYVASW